MTEGFQCVVFSHQPEETTITSLPWSYGCCSWLHLISDRCPVARSKATYKARAQSSLSKRGKPHFLHRPSPTKKQPRTLRVSSSHMAALRLTVLPMPSDSACHHPYYPLRRNRIRTWQEPDRLRYRSQPPASWEVGNFQQHRTDAAPLYISSSAPAPLASHQHVTTSITCPGNVSAVLP